MSTPQQRTNGEGFENYDWFHYLWHLIAIGVIEPADPDAKDGCYEIKAGAWGKLPLKPGQRPGEGEIVALIDTGVNDLHPNLAPRVLPGINFAAHPFGMTYDVTAPVPQAENLSSLVAQPTELERGLETQGKSLRDSVKAAFERLTSLFQSAEQGTKAAEDAEDAKVQEENARELQLLASLGEGRGVVQTVTDLSRLYYSAHGTACAGLIMGAAEDGPGAGGRPLDKNGGPIPYWGVAPGARLLPITVSAEPTPQQLILAFAYAASYPGVSVIHFPREAPDPWLAPKHWPGYPGYPDTRYLSDKARTGWSLFAKVFASVAKGIPVVCAAGNDGYDHLIYPASRAADTEGVIAVGAVTYKGRRSAYSNYDGPDGRALTIAAPSDDGEVYTRHQVRFRPGSRIMTFATTTTTSTSRNMPRRWNTRRNRSWPWIFQARADMLAGPWREPTAAPGRRTTGRVSTRCSVARPLPPPSLRARWRYGSRSGGLTGFLSTGPL